MRLSLPLLIALVSALVVMLAGATDAVAGVALVEKGPVDTGAGTSVTGTLGTASTSGDLLVAVIMDANGDCSSDTMTAPGGWVEAIHTCRGSTGPLELWYDADAASGITSVVFDTGSSAPNLTVQLSEWSGVATTSPLDQTGTASNTTASNTMTVTTSASIGSAGELAVTGFLSSSGLSSYTPGSGWTNIGSSTSSGYDSDYDLNPTSGSTLSESVTTSPQTTWAGVIASFKAAGCSGGGLTIEAAPTLSFGAVTLDGYNENATANASLTLSDESGSAAGWDLSGTSTTLTASSHTLPTTATTITGASASAASGNCNLPTNAVSYPVTLPAGATAPTAVSLYSAAASTGEGPSTVTLDAKIVVPANAYAGSYTSTWTLTLSSGP